jgi:hypothetical protein
MTPQEREKPVQRPDITRGDMAPPPSPEPPPPERRPRSRSARRGPVAPVASRGMDSMDYAKGGKVRGYGKARGGRACKMV